MLAWMIWAARCAACVFFGGVGLILCVACLTGQKQQIVMAGVSSLFVVAAALSWPRRPSAWRRDPPTERQVAYAIDLGLDIPPGVSKGELSDMISAARGR
jgi:hypothetical protein